VGLEAVRYPAGESGNPVTSYAGTVQLTSTDPQAVFSPNPYTFVPATDGGSHLFTVTLKTAAAQTVTVTDQSTGSFSGQTVTVNPTSLDHLVLSPANASISAGGSQSFSATGIDKYGNSLGHVTAATTFTISPDGSCTGNSCSASVTGAHVVTGTDAGTTGVASLTVDPAGLNHLVLTGLATETMAGAPLSSTVTVYDGYGNIITDYTGTVLMTSSDPLAVVTPSAYTFTKGDAGDHSFEVVFNTAGAQTVTATDQQTRSASSQTVSVDKVSFSVSGDTAVTEGGTATETVGYAGRLLPGATASVQVGISGDDNPVLAPSTLGAGVSYSGGTLTFTGGVGNASSQSFLVGMSDDGVAHEAAQSCTVTLTSPSPDASLGASSFALTITEDLDPCGPGANDQVAGHGYAAGETVDFFYAGSTGTLVGSCTTDATGFCVTAFTVPFGYPTGSYDVVGVGQTSGLSAGAGFTQDKAAVNLNGLSGGPGTNDQVAGHGYAAGEMVDFFYAGSTGTLVGSCTTDATGFCVTAFTVPFGYPTGSYDVVGVGQTSGLSAGAGFTQT
jgi:hypothetical protein